MNHTKIYYENSINNANDNVIKMISIFKYISLTGKSPRLYLSVESLRVLEAMTLLKFIKNDNDGIYITNTGRQLFELLTRNDI